MRVRLPDPGKVSILGSQSIYQGLTAEICLTDNLSINLMYPEGFDVSVGFTQEMTKEVDLAWRISDAPQHIGLLKNVT